MEEILSQKVPDFNSSEYEHLVNILEKGACIFYGAGISKIAGYKLWDELKVMMVDHFWNNRDLLDGENKKNLITAFVKT